MHQPQQKKTLRSSPNLASSCVIKVFLKSIKTASSRSSPKPAFTQHAIPLVHKQRVTPNRATRYSVWYQTTKIPLAKEHMGCGIYGTHATHRTWPLGHHLTLLSLQSLLSFFTPLWEANESNKNKAVQHMDGFILTTLFRIRAL